MCDSAFALIMGLESPTDWSFLETRKPQPSPQRDADGLFRPALEQLTERAVLVGVHLLGQHPGAAATYADLDELERLAETAGAEVAGRMVQRRAAPSVRSLLGKGKAEQLKLMVEALEANLVVFDNDLSPAQGRNLEKLIECRVIDRTELILDIFARHARTKQSRLQVGVAQYEYLLPRLARMWKHLERQAGGIGTRGPGEAQIETDRRIIRTRISQMKRELRVIDERMRTQHKQRESAYRVALTGYTNAGKSSLMNRITSAGVFVEDQLFATLDATTRRVQTPDDHLFLLTDTVGFVRNLPHHLVESFRATLSEVAEADLLLHVIDAGDSDVEGRMEAVDQVLDTLSLPETQERWLVFNKTDTLDAGRREALEHLYPDASFTSAQSGDGITQLLDRVAGRLRREERELQVRLSSGNGRSLAQLHELGVVHGVRYEDGSALVSMRVDPPNYGRVVQLEGVEVLEVRSRG